MSGTRRLVVEADGGSRGNPGPAAFGALVRRVDTGEVLAEVAETLGVATNNVAEYRGVIAGLRAAHDIDPDASVEARLDSKLIVEQMSGRWKIKNSDLQPLALEARRIFPPGRVSYTWVPRAQNTYADTLVNQALDGKPIGLGPVAARRAQTTARAQVAEAELTEPVPPNRLPGWSPELGVPTRLLAIRHGQTELTAAQRFSGGDVPGPGLDDTGRAQADRAAAALADSGAVAVVCSPLPRAVETAEIIARGLDVAVEHDDDWREYRYGRWDGLTLAEVQERFPVELAAWYADTSVPAPGGESLDDLARRVRRARGRTLARHPEQPVIVVTHSMAIRALVTLALGAPNAATFRLRPMPVSLTAIDVYIDGTTVVDSVNRPL